MGPALHRVGCGLLAIIAEAHPDATRHLFQSKRDELVVPQVIRVPNNVGAGFVYSEDHEKALTLGEGIRLQERPDELAHGREIASVAGKLHLLTFLHRTGETLNACAGAFKCRTQNRVDSPPKHSSVSSCENCCLPSCSQPRLPWRRKTQARTKRCG